MTLLELASLLFLMVHMSNCDEYRIEGSHWFSSNDPYSNINQGIFELEKLFSRQDAHNLAKKYADDCMFVHEELGVMRGPDEVQNGCEQMFASGIAGIHVDVIKVGMIGKYRYAMTKWYYFDIEGGYLKESLVLVVLKQVKDGYKTYLKMEMNQAASGNEIKPVMHEDEQVSMTEAPFGNGLTELFDNIPEETRRKGGKRGKGKGKGKRLALDIDGI